MSDTKLGIALIAECRRLIAEEVADRLEGKDRFTAKMIARALNVAERDLTQSDQVEVAEQAATNVLLGEGGNLQQLASFLRSGRFDGEAPAYQALLEITERRVAISNPTALKG